MSAEKTYEVSGYFQDQQHNQPVLPAKPEPLTLNPAETAVIVVDIQNAYASKDGYLDKAGFDVSSTAPAIANTLKVLDTARSANMPVIFFQNGWDPDYKEAGGPGSPNWYKSNALKAMRKDPSLAGSLLAKGTWDYQLVDALVPQQDDIVIPKTRYSGFYNTHLDSMLRSRGIRNLVFTGIATNVCVESTLRDGFHREYFGVVLADATYQAGPPHIHEASLYNIETFFGWVSTTKHFCEVFSQYQTSHLPTDK
ncbi:pyrimidine utilization protein B [Alteromonas sp. 14N.309.X.WAT.G.H12]|uniref:pyrimidine utilization protein B n=1 Tax=Alteromonas sp. 14N.309.X.WAT.G.H12 TaxID=3120824 RepID=UPI002FD42D8D